ncbi:hypothetical protein [Butyrivibrio proteoclasticus]|uniref:hypothetical protein n=1 Tax=Butyrivibrio proteoclasticus TaxID=43305 RepID=UPI0012DF1A28|nr:hypothetical protein [Butyrivibrio proteoclasticus]
MVILVVGMLAYQYLLIRPDIKSSIRPADVVVLLLMLLLSVSFLRDVSAYQAYIKVMSAFLLYFMGRLYYDRILECDDALSLSSYLIIYINFIYRLFVFGIRFFSVTNANGDLYYYDTDMAYAMILAFIFIAMFARNSVFKYVTMLLVCPYMIFWSDADIQQLMFVLIFIVLLIYIVEIALRKRAFAMASMAILLVLLVSCVVFIHLPMITMNSDGIRNLFDEKPFLNFTNMESRYSDWQSVFDIRKPTSVIEMLFGISFNTTLPLRSFYLKAFFTTGVVGIILGIVLIALTFIAATKNEERKSFYVTIMLAILMLGSGVTVNTMETTQMSWFMMLFAGMVISAKDKSME